MRYADPEETKGGAGRFALEQRLGGREDTIGEDGCILERGIAGPKLEIGRLQFEGDCIAGKLLRLGSS